MVAMPPFLAPQWQVGVGVGKGSNGGLPQEKVKILGPNGCILGYFCTLSVLLLADIMRHLLL